MTPIDRSISSFHAVHGGFTSARAPLSEHEKLVKNTQKWVAQTFYGTMLKEMRKSPFRQEEFEGGREGQAYEEMFDQRLADHMSEGAGSKLVNTIVDRIESRHGQPRSARTNLDATTAYAQAMRHLAPGASKKASATSPRSGRIPPAQYTVPANHKPASPAGHRRQDRILPELTHVAPTA